MAVSPFLWFQSSSCTEFFLYLSFLVIVWFLCTKGWGSLRTSAARFWPGPWCCSPGQGIDACVCFNASVVWNPCRADLQPCQSFDDPGQDLEDSCKVGEVSWLGRFLGALKIVVEQSSLLEPCFKLLLLVVLVAIVVIWPWTWKDVYCDLLCWRFHCFIAAQLSFRLSCAVCKHRAPAMCVMLYLILRHCRVMAAWQAIFLWRFDYRIESGIQLFFTRHVFLQRRLGKNCNHTWCLLLMGSGQVGLGFHVRTIIRSQRLFISKSFTFLRNYWWKQDQYFNWTLWWQ